jgi:hypothetical protein
VTDEIKRKRNPEKTDALSNAIPKNGVKRKTQSRNLPVFLKAHLRHTLRCLRDWLCALAPVTALFGVFAAALQPS